MLFSIFKKYQAILCHFLSKNGCYQLFPITHSFREKKFPKFDKMWFFESGNFFLENYRSERKIYKDHFA